MPGMIAWPNTVLLTGSEPVVIDPGYQTQGDMLDGVLRAGRGDDGVELSRWGYASRPAGQAAGRYATPSSRGMRASRMGASPSWRATTTPPSCSPMTMTFPLSTP